MTKERKLEILWDLYFIAIGLDTLMTREEIIDLGQSEMPHGLCRAACLAGIEYYEREYLMILLQRYRTSKKGLFHHKMADWSIRSKVLLKAIRKVSKEIKQ